MKFSAFVTPKVSANTVLDWRDYTVFACLEGTMSAECSTSSSLKESPLHTKISRYLFYFIWMLVDTLFFVLGTVCMILVVSNSEAVTDYFASHPNAQTILIALGIAATIILVLLRRFKYENVVDHLLILIGYLLISFGFAGAFLYIQLFCSLISLFVTVTVSGIVTFLGLAFKAVQMKFTVIIFIVGCVFAGIGVLMIILQHFFTDKMPYIIVFSASMSICAIIFIFMTINRMRLCVSYNVFYCSIIFRAFCMWLGMLIMFTSVYYFQDTVSEKCKSTSWQSLLKYKMIFVMCGFQCIATLHK
uniref:Uncharacterized protein n=3 Tax=Trichobilharzia regenti TaxID=157069 RepID=A0AA85J413_TRIRE|nr:unnamed protein product [Trichobilharzia regenti]